MGRKKLSIHLIILLSTLEFVLCSKILYYHEVDQPPEQLQCSTVEFKEQPGCVCLNGLWKLKTNCTTYAITAADSYCFSPETEISHAIEIVPNNESIAILTKDDRVVQLPIPLLKGGVEIKASDFMVTGTPYTVTGVFGVTCLYPQDEAYCYFNPMDVIGNKIISVSKGCDPETPMDVPSRCAFIKGPKVCLFERSLLSKERKVKEGITIHSLAASAPSHVWLGDPSRTKRESNWGSGNYRARTFFGVPGQEFEVVQGPVTGTNFSNYDEDLEANENENGTSVKEEILNEVWNYIDFHLQVILGIKSNADQEIDYGLPYFRLLHLSKKVMKKICPTDYVPHSYLDLSVNAFIQVLMKRVFYEAPTTNLPGFMRIVNALESCIDAAKPFPFLTREDAASLPTEAPSTTEPVTTKPARHKRQGTGKRSKGSARRQNARDALGDEATTTPGAETPTTQAGTNTETTTGVAVDGSEKGPNKGETNSTSSGVSSEPPKDWDVKCPSGPLRDGRFKFLGGALQLNVTESFVGLNKDPIIETVWKIFWSTVNACFHHFEGKKSSFNDHHRFIAWMIVLFENSIVETWKAGRAENSTFGGLLGNMETTMRSLAYCAASTRFPIKYNQTKYPWELTRPFEGEGTEETTAGPENPEEGTGGTGTPGTGAETTPTSAPEGATETTKGTDAPPAQRRKRRLSMPKITCADHHHFSQCTNADFSKIKARSQSFGLSVTPRKILYSQNG